MTRETAKVIIKDLLTSDTQFKDKPLYQELYQAIKTALDNQIKYEWHDLRKDPTDLPEEKGRKYLITQCGNSAKYIVAEWDGEQFGDWTCIFSDEGYIFSGFALVDSWKYIEPFRIKD